MFENSGEATKPVGPKQGNLMKEFEGSWQGNNTLWLKYPEDPQVSKAEVVISAGEIRYSWTYKDKPHTGVIKVRGEANALTFEWTDTFHSPKPMLSKGSMEEGVINVLGTYAAGDGPDWSWRTVIHKSEKGKLNIKMYNILPDGLYPEHKERELLAVNMDLSPNP